MKHITLRGTARTKGRKSLTKSIRREGLVPCNLYGNGVENVLFSVDARDLKALTHTPNSYIVDLDIDGKNQKEMVSAMKLTNAHNLPIFIIADTFNRVVFVSQGYTIGLGEQLMQVIHKL